MRKIILGALAGLLAVGAGLYLAVWRPLFAVAETVPLAEQVLATPDLLVLGGLNVKQAVFLERWFLATPASAPPSGAPAPAVPDRSLLDHLRAAHVDPRKDLDYVLYALYPGGGGEASGSPGDGSAGDGSAFHQAIALAGRFDSAGIGAYLANDLHAKPIPTAAGHPSYEVTLTDPASCKAASSWVVTAEPGWILIADPASYAALAPRLSGPPPPGNESEVEWWRGLARSDVLSVAIRKPDQFDSATSIPFLKSAAQEIAPEVEAFQRLYLGLGIEAVPPEGRLRLVIDAKDTQRAVERIAAWQRAVRDSRDRWAGTMPTVAGLYDSLAIRTEGARSTIDVTVNRATAARLQDVGNEVVASVLSGFGLSPDAGRPFDKRSGAGSASAAERIESNPPKFEPVAALSRLGPYDPNAQFAEKVDRIAGPFGLRLETIRLGEAGLEVAVEGFSNGIPNLTAGSERAKLFVDSVTSGSGQEIMKREECGRERNSEPAKFADAFAPNLKASKTVRLTADADARALRRINGHVELRLPSRTETVTVAHPKPGTSVEKYGVRVAVNQAEGGSLSYQITGARDRVLALRALNAKGQPLASSMKMSGDLLFGEGVAGRNDYGGSISALEIVLAAEEQTAEFPFVLEDFSFAGDNRAPARDEAPEFQPYSLEALRRDYALPGRAGAWKPLPPPGEPQASPRPPGEPKARLGGVALEPFELSLDKVQSFYALKLDFTLRAPEAANFRRRFNVGQLRLTRIALKDGSALTPPAANDSPGPRAPIRSVWAAPVRFMSTPRQGVLATSPSFLIDTKAKPEDLQSVAGAFSLQVPTALATLRLDDLSVGQKAQWQDMTITLAARGRRNLVLQTSKDGDRVVYVRLLDAQGQALAFFGPEITGLSDGGARFDLSPLAAPARAEVVIATEMETQTLPFAFSLP